MGRVVVEEVLPGGVLVTRPLVGAEGARVVVLGCCCGRETFLFGERLDPKPPKPLNREFIKSIQWKRKNDNVGGRGKTIEGGLKKEE